MNPPLDLHAPIPILQPVAGSRLSVVAGEGLPRGPSLTGLRERSDSSGVTSNPVTRAIDDLKGSGYRPLHPDPTRPPRASMGIRPQARVTGLTPIRSEGARADRGKSCHAG